MRSATKDADLFHLTLGSGSVETFDRLIVATGGNKSSGGLALAESFGHTIVAPVPSLFTFHITDPRIADLAGISVEHAVVTAPGTKLKTDGPVLITHAGLSGRVCQARQPLWLRDADNVLRIRRLIAEDHARDLTVFRTDASGGLAQVSTVDEARYVDGRWLMTGIKRTELHGTETKVVTLDQIEISGSITPNVLKLFILEGDVLSVRGLYNLVAYMEENKLDATKYRIWLWRKLVEPLTVMAMMLFAVPFVVGTLRDSGAGQRLLAGVMVGIVFYVLNKVSVSVGDLYQWPAPVAAGLPTAILGTLALWRLRLAR